MNAKLKKGTRVVTDGKAFECEHCDFDAATEAVVNLHEASCAKNPANTPRPRSSAVATGTLTSDAAAERQAAGHSMMADWIVCLGLVCTSLGFEWAYEHVAQTHLWPLLAQWSETLPPAHGVSGGGGGASGAPPATQQEGREQDRLGLARRAEAFGHIFALLGTIGAAGIGLGSAGTGTDDGVAMLRGVLEGTMQQHLDGDQTFGMPIGIGLARALLRFAAKTNDAEEKTRLVAIPLQWAKMLSRHEWEAELPRDLKLRLAGSRPSASV